MSQTVADATIPDGADDAAVTQMMFDVTADFFDPVAAQFRGLSIGNASATWCGEVNRRNETGAYVGFRPFWYRPSHGAFGIWEDPNDDPVSAPLRLLTFEFNGCAERLGIAKPAPQIIDGTGVVGADGMLVDIIFELFLRRGARPGRYGLVAIEDIYDTQFQLLSLVQGNGVDRSILCGMLNGKHQGTFMGLGCLQLGPPEFQPASLRSRARAPRALEDIAGESSSIAY